MTTTLKEKFIGSWELIEHGFRTQTGEFKQTSDFLLGRLIYESGGFVSVTIALKNPVGATTDLIAYAGRFSIQENRVFHHVEVASRSNRIGQVEERITEFKDNKLILRTSPTAEGFYEITWSKMNPQ